MCQCHIKSYWILSSWAAPKWLQKCGEWLGSSNNTNMGWCNGSKNAANQAPWQLMWHLLACGIGSDYPRLVIRLQYRVLTFKKIFLRLFQSFCCLSFYRSGVNMSYCHFDSQTPCLLFAKHWKTQILQEGVLTNFNKPTNHQHREPIPSSRKIADQCARPADKWWFNDLTHSSCHIIDKRSTHKTQTTESWNAPRPLQLPSTPPYFLMGAGPPGLLNNFW